MSGQRCDPSKGCWVLSSCQWNEEEYICFHDPILDLTPYTGFVYCLIPIFLGTGVLGGLGSGMIKRPILNLLLNYPARIATQVGDCFLFSTTSLNTFLLFFEKHPDHPELPLINFNISIIFSQAIPIAWCIGAYLQQLVPIFAIYMIQLCFLLSAIPFLRKYTNRQKKLELDKRDKKVLIVEKIKTQDEIQLETNLENDHLKQYQKFYKNDHQKVQIKNLCFIFGSFIVNQTIILMRSNRFNNSIIGLDPCTFENNLIILLLLGANFIYTTLVYWNKRNEEIYKDLVQYRPEERYYIHHKTFWMYYLGGWLSGFCTGFIGMGGGLILVAFLLYHNVIAREAAGTAAFGAFLISLNGLIQLYLQLTISIHDVIIFLSLGFIGILLISKPAYMLMNKYKVGYVVLLIDMIEVIFNIVSIIALIIINLILFGFNTLTKHHTNC